MLKVKLEPIIMMGSIILGMSFGWGYHKAMIVENCFGQCSKIQMLPSGVVGYILFGLLYGIVVGFLAILAYKLDSKRGRDE